MEGYLFQLIQLRAAMREIHTSGEDTLRMAGCLNFMDQVIQTAEKERGVDGDGGDKP